MQRFLIVVFVSLNLLVLFGSGTTVRAANRSSFALLNTTDTSVQCGAIKGSPSKKKPTNFIIFITMTNFGGNGHVKVSYEDGDLVLYQIPAGGTLNISLAGGGFPDLDQLITVTEEGGADLAGQMSILVFDSAKPHPDIDPDFCRTN